MLDGFILNVFRNPHRFVIVVMPLCNAFLADIVCNNREMEIYLCRSLGIENQRLHLSCSQTVTVFSVPSPFPFPFPQAPK